MTRRYQFIVLIQKFELHCLPSPQVILTLFDVPYDSRCPTRVRERWSQQASSLVLKSNTPYVRREAENAGPTVAIPACQSASLPRRGTMIGQTWCTEGNSEFSRHYDQFNMVFYPDNEKRATRLQQLVDSMANLQTNVKGMGKEMDEQNVKYRPTINKLLKANKMDSVDDLLNKVAAKMTPEERKVFEALIKTAKGSKAGFDTTYFVGSLLMVPEGAVLTGKLAIAIAKWGSNMVSLKALADFFKAAESGAEAAAAAAAEAAAGAEEAEKTLQGAGEAGVEVSRSMVWLGLLGTFFKVLGAVGFVITLVAGIVELVEGEEQKRKLVAAIHGLQPARLTTAFFKQEGLKIMEQLTTLQVYLDASPGGSDPDPTVAAYIGKKLVKKIAEEHAAIDLNKLEGEFEAEDRSSTLFYGGDDLSRAEVVAIAAPDTK